MIEPGAPMLVMELPGIKRRKVRCVQCAGEPVPDLPRDAAPVQQRTKRLAPIAKVAGDWKRRSVGEREPGMEG